MKTIEVKKGHILQHEGELNTKVYHVMSFILSILSVLIYSKPLQGGFTL